MGIIALILIVFFYLLPSIVACSNKKANAGAIVVLNLFLGWSGLGWLVALVWACTKDPQRDIIQVFESSHKGTLGYVRKK